MFPANSIRAYGRNRVTRMARRRPVLYPSFSRISMYLFLRRLMAAGAWMAIAILWLPVVACLLLLAATDPLY